MGQHKRKHKARSDLPAWITGFNRFHGYFKQESLADWVLPEAESDSDVLVYVTCPVCKNPGVLRSYRHGIDTHGVVSPSYVCPYKPCPFHRFVTLVGWNGGRVGLRETTFKPTMGYR